MDADQLFQRSIANLHLLVATASETCDFAWSLQRSPGRTAVVRTLRAAKGRTVPALFDEFAAALQFPYYFGENWDALDECLTDLEWLPGDAYILFITDSQWLLDREPSKQFALLLDVLSNAAQRWNVGEETELQSPRPFHIVFQCSSESVPAFLTRIDAEGRTLNRLI
jgi:hypothetical protein